MEDSKSGVVAVKQFTEEFIGQHVNFYVLRLKQSFLVWVGTEATFKTLAVAMKTRFDVQPTSTQLIGDATNAASSNLAKRLAKKTGCQCFVSLNVSDTSLHPLIEQFLMKFVETDPTTFYF